MRIQSLRLTLASFPLLLAVSCGNSTDVSESPSGDGAGGSSSEGGSAGTGGADAGGTAGSGGTDAGGSAGSAGAGGTDAGGSGGTGTSSDCDGEAGFVCCSTQNDLTPAVCIEDMYRCAAGLIRASSGVCEGVDERTAEAPGCFQAGGACVPRGQCSSSVAGAHNGECQFDDGPGECCIFPRVQDSGSSCTSLGGLCAPVGGCNKVLGYLVATGDCGANPTSTCCVAQSQCGNPLAECCSETESWSAVTSCERGELVCGVEGMELMRPQDCADIVGG